MASARQKAKLAGKGQKARMKPDQIAFVFRHSRSEVVVDQMSRHAAQRLKSVNMAAQECFEALTVRELDVHHAAVTFHQREGVQLARIAGVEEGAEVPPVDLEAISWWGFHADVSAAPGRLCADLVQIVL